jgi:flagellar M-ring protein FliF
MSQLSELFRRLSWTQRIMLLAVTVGVVGVLYQLAQWNQERDFKPLFTGLAAEDAGAVTAKLKEMGIEYRLKEDGSAILVSASRIAEARLQLAAEGLPRSGRIGFELFDKTNFGASEFTEQVNYQRAVEGELERSVMSIREVEQARVHITPAKDSIYTESRQPAKASVLVKLKRAAALTPQNVAAICQLAASAVPGLIPDQVSVMDTSGNLLNRPKSRGIGDTESSEAAIEYRKSVERDLQTKVAATLEPLLGAEHFRVGVSADVDLTSGDQSEEIYDPQKSVMVSSQKTEDGPVLPASSGVPGTPSNIPNPTGRTASGASTTNYSRRTESINYQTSRLVKHVKLPQGTVKKLSLSVLVDHTLRWQGQKRIVEPPSAEKLKVIKDLVSAATGLDTNRGDQLVVDAFPFEATLTAEPLTDRPAPAPAPENVNLPPWLQKLMGQKNFALIAGIGAAAAVLLMAGFFFLWRRSSRKRISAEAGTAIEGGGRKELKGPDVGKQMEEKLAEQAAEIARKEAEALLSLKVGTNVSTKKTEVLTKHISAEIKQNPAAMAHVVRSWLNGEYQR